MYFGEGGQGVQGGHQGASRYYLPSTNGLNNVGSFKMLTKTGIIAQCRKQKSNFRPCLFLSGTDFYEFPLYLGIGSRPLCHGGSFKFV